MNGHDDPTHGRQRDGTPDACGCGDGTGGRGCGRNEGAPDSGRTSRRDFLKVLGLSGAGAAAGACGPPDVGDRLIPYLVPPDDVTPGATARYATVLRRSGPAPVPVHAMVRDGRVLNLEGNPDFPGTLQGVSPLVLSSLQDLYDPDRIRGPKRRSAPAGGDDGTGPTGEDRVGLPTGTPGALTGGGWETIEWEEGLGALGQAVAGGTTVLLTPAVAGTADRFYAAWATAAGAEHVRYGSFDLEALREAHRIAFGRAEVPSYALDRADHVVCFGADFLESWLAPTELARRFARARRVEEGRYARLVFVGPRLSLTGTNADEWLAARSGTEALVALAAAHVVAARRGGARAARAAALLEPYAPEAVAERTGVPAEKLVRLGEDMAAAEAPVALPPGVAGQGPHATDAHLAVAVLNWVAGAIGSTVLFGRGPVRLPTATYAEMEGLVQRMDAGEIETLVVVGVNPAFTLPAASGFAAALESVGTVVALSSHADETTAAADLVLPTHHELEAWGDVEVRPGDRALQQPVMQPVWDTRQAENILLEATRAAGIGFDPGTSDFAAYLRNRWREVHAGSDAAVPFEEWWTGVLARGGVYRSGEEEGPTPATVDLTGAALSHDFPDFFVPEGMGLVTFPTGHLYDGRGANRSWMQEFPDPVTKLVWASWVELHPETAGPLGLETGDVVEVSSDAGTLRVPVFLYRGIRPDTAAIPMGQGHTAYGRYAAGRGVNPLGLLEGRTDARSGSLAFAGTAVEITATGERSRLVNLQGSDTDEGREVAELMGVAAARDAIEAHQVDLASLVEAAYDSDPMSPYRWGMTVDLNACTGCGACVTACYAENNLPVVGERQAARGREMAWLRVERYFEETAEGGFQTVHEPMLCQQCGDAPCEPVCPVYATYHNPEGLNVQVYNRCVGTRYCSNNCPYKVRRFNYFTGEFPEPLNLQLNPDVTARQKGVMEKCTFCVQRINRAKIEWKERGRLVPDGAVETACQTACPTEAIVFGNLKDPSSKVSQIARGARAYHVLDELNTRPAVTYLKDVTAAELPAGGEGEGAGGH